MMPWMNIDKIALREARRKLKLTGKEMARRMGYERTYYSKVENGVYPTPAAKFIRKAAAVLQLPVEKITIPDVPKEIPPADAFILRIWQQLPLDGKNELLAAGQVILTRYREAGQLEATPELLNAMALAALGTAATDERRKAARRRGKPGGGQARA